MTDTRFRNAVFFRHAGSHTCRPSHVMPTLTRHANPHTSCRPSHVMPTLTRHADPHTSCQLSHVMPALTRHSRLSHVMPTLIRHGRPSHVMPTLTRHSRLSYVIAGSHTSCRLGRHLTHSRHVPPCSYRFQSAKLIPRVASFAMSSAE